MANYDDEALRHELLRQLEDSEWDLSEETLENVAEKLSHFFSSLDDAREFVEENASYLYKSIEEFYE